MHRGLARQIWKQMYNKRTWLGKCSSSSTGNVVAFDGMVKWKDENIQSTFLSISDCNNSVRLHPMDDDSRQDFIDKMTILRNEIDEFIKYLRADDTLDSECV